MPDIRLIPIAQPDVVTLDWLQTATGLLDETEQLATAIMLALNTDGLADESDKLPMPGATNRRGWWGDLDAESIWGGWAIGSKLWLLTRAKIVDSSAKEGATITRVEAYCRACLQPFVTAGICTRFTVTAVQDTSQRITATIIVYRGDKAAIQLEYQPVWAEIFPGS